MEDEVNLRRLVMKKAAAGNVGRPLISSQSPQLIPTSSQSQLIQSTNQNYNAQNAPLNSQNYQSISHNYNAHNSMLNSQPEIDQLPGRRNSAIVESVGPDFSKLSKELNRVVLKIQHQGDVSTDCQLHNMDPSESRRGSRAHDVIRRRNKDSESIDQENRRSLVINSSGQSSHHRASRTSSTDKLSNSKGSLIDHYYQSLPRKLNKDQHSKVDRRQSFQPQDYRGRQVRDKFVGKLEFKDTLRQLEREPRRPIRRGRQISGGPADYTGPPSSNGGSRDYLGPPSGFRDGLGSNGGSRDYLGPSGGSRDYLGPGSRDYYNHPERNSAFLIESDFDFRSPPSTRDNSRDRSRISKYDNPQYAVPRRGQEDTYARTSGIQDVSRGREDPYASPRGREDPYASPRNQYNIKSSQIEDPYATPSRGQNTGGHYAATSKGGVEETYAAGGTRGRWDTSQGKKKELRIQINGEVGKIYDSSIRSPELETSMKDPLSPRRVEFADSVFSFRSQQTNTISRPESVATLSRPSSRPGSRPESRPGSRPESPAPKSILRHTNSDNGGLRGSSHHAAVRSNTSDLSFCQGMNSPTVNRPTTLIIPTDGSASFSTQHFNSQISIEHKNKDTSSHSKDDNQEGSSHSNGEESDENDPCPTIIDDDISDTNNDDSNNHKEENKERKDSNGTVVERKDSSGNLVERKESSGNGVERKDSSGSGVSFCHGGSSSKEGIHVPPVKIQVQDCTEENGTAEIDSDGTVTDEPKYKHNNNNNNDSQQTKTTASSHQPPKKQRVVPPPLADWNRSQSFPQGSVGEVKGDGRKVSDPSGLNPAFSMDSLNEINSEIDIFRSENSNLRVRIGDLERVIVDNNVEIKCLKATLAECLRRIDDIETHIRHCPGTRDDEEIIKRRPLSSAGVYTALEQQKGDRRSQYTSRS